MRRKDNKAVVEKDFDRSLLVGMNERYEQKEDVMVGEVAFRSEVMEDMLIEAFGCTSLDSVKRFDASKDRAWNRYLDGMDDALIAAFGGFSSGSVEESAAAPYSGEDRAWNVYLYGMEDRLIEAFGGISLDRLDARVIKLGATIDRKRIKAHWYPPVSQVLSRVVGLA
jgi:hypothetical protein